MEEVSSATSWPTIIYHLSEVNRTHTQMHQQSRVRGLGDLGKGPDPSVVRCEIAFCRCTDSIVSHAMEQKLVVAI